jgi:hypothetical protein
MSEDQQVILRISSTIESTTLNAFKAHVQTMTGDWVVGVDGHLSRPTPAGVGNSPMIVMAEIKAQYRDLIFADMRRVRSETGPGKGVTVPVILGGYENNVIASILFKGGDTKIWNFHDIQDYWRSRTCTA